MKFKESIQEYTTIKNVYAPNNKLSKWTELKGEIDKFKTRVDFNTPLSVLDRKSRLKIRDNIVNLNNTINQLIGMYRRYQTKT